MRDTAKSYWASEIQKKVLNALAQNYVHSKIKKERKELAKVHFKKVMMFRWMIAKNRVQTIRNELINNISNLEFTESYKHLNTNLRKSL